ncbi:MAG TPA: hypothetical protein VHA33_12515 [Candidatus Angelobacter sp.]|nr:hypothetical protein [Candidatus Angelobacter sp.]
MLCLAGCGTPGAPQPPSLNIPKPIRDLQATRKGDSIALTWTNPTETTDGALVKKTGKVFVRRGFTASEGSSPVPASALGEVPLPPALKDGQSGTAAFRDSLANIQTPPSANFAAYTVQPANSSGRTSGNSNQVFVPLVPTPPAPKNVRAEVIPDGVKISFDPVSPVQRDSGLTARYASRIMRRLEGSKQPVVVAEPNIGNEAMAVIDKGIEWEKKYEYWVTPVTYWQQDDNHKGVVEGEDSPVIPVFTKDIFPPAVPSGLQAVYSGVAQQPFIDLTWTPNTEPDLAGYNIYRRTEGQQVVKINSDPVKTPAHRDTKVQPGTKYFYSVSALDLRGNESARSQETSESVPQQ